MEFDGVTFTYAGSKKPALEDVNLKIRKGECVLIAGPNAAGKTTLCRCLNGLVPHFFLGDLHGKVKVNEIDTKQSQIGRLSQIAGLVFDDPTSQLVCSTIADEVAFGAENLGVPREEIDRRVEESLKAVRLTGYENRIPQTASGGEQQAIAIASIMTMDPDVFVLDEPTSNLDPVGSMQVLSIVSDLARKQEKTLLVVSHNIEQFVNLADRMVVIDKGKLVLDASPREALQRGDQLLELGLSPPQVTALFAELQKRNLAVAKGRIPTTLEEAYDRLKGISIAGASTKQEVSDQSTEPLIMVDGVSFQYPGSNAFALQDVNLKIGKKEFVAIVGQNGSGKTTLVKHFNGLLKPSKGRVLAFGSDTTKFPLWELSRKIGFVFQNPDVQLFNTSVRKEIEFSLKATGFPEDKREDRVNSMAKRFSIDQYLDQSPGTLDKGGRQRVAIASVLALDPGVLVVDEPTTGQDPKNSRQLMDIAKELHSEGKTIVFITHNMEIVAEYAKRGIIMWQGQVLFDGPVTELFQQTQALTRSYLEPPQIVRLAQMLKDRGFPSTALTVNDMAQLIEESAGGL